MTAHRTLPTKTTSSKATSSKVTSSKATSSKRQTVQFCPLLGAAFKGLHSETHFRTLKALNSAFRAYLSAPDELGDDRTMDRKRATSSIDSDRHRCPLKRAGSTKTHKHEAGRRAGRNRRGPKPPRAANRRGPKSPRRVESTEHESTNTTPEYISVGKSSPCGISGDLDNFRPLLTTLL